MNELYISKRNTKIINGFFVLLIFISHSFSYHTFESSFGKWISHFITIDFGQLMVTSFLFYSGYGVFESFKNKDGYINSFPKKRILSTYLKFLSAWVLFLIIYLIKGDINKKQILKSLVLWDPIGNSNWYIFMILLMYIITYIWLRFAKSDEHALWGIFITSILTIVVFSYLKPNYWSNTVLCYSLGMFYSFYKLKIEKRIFDGKKHYYVVLGALVALFVINRVLYGKVENRVLSNLYHNLISCFFILSIVLLSMRFKFGDSFGIIEFFGKYCFWIYILQRIPMMLVKIDNYFVYIVITFVLTCVLAVGFEKMFSKINKYIEKIPFLTRVKGIGR